MSSNDVEETMDFENHHVATIMVAGVINSYQDRWERFAEERDVGIVLDYHLTKYYSITNGKMMIHSGKIWHIPT